MTTYEVTGRNFGKFLAEVERRNIALCELVKISGDKFCVKVALAQKKKFLALCNALNLSLEEKSIPVSQKFFRGLKSHLPFAVFAAMCMAVVIFSQMFVFKIEVFGETTVPEAEIVSVLRQNGFETWKFRGEYKTGEVEKILTAQIPKISFASCVVRGGTLVVNVFEKIDHEETTSAGNPIVAPCDLIVKSISATSGTALKHATQSARAGEVLVANYVQLGQSKIDVPAHAKIVARVEQSISQFLSVKPQDEESIKKVVEENKKMLYNMLSKVNLLDEITEETELLETENGCLATSRFKVEIEISS